MFKMRHIATSTNGSYFLTAEFEKKVYCWDLETQAHISSFDTILSFGGAGLAISEDGAHCVAAAYERYGVSMYDILNGTVIWQRKDIKKAGPIKFDPSNEKLYISIDEKPMQVIDRNTGCDIEKLNAIREVYFDPLSSKPLFLKGRFTVVHCGNAIISLYPTLTFIDIDITGKGVILSVVGNDLFYYSFAEQKIVWKITPKQEEHFIKVAYSEKNQIIYAIMYKYGEQRTSPYHLLYGISEEDGTIKFTFPLPMGSCEFGFAQKATKLICSSGEIFEMSCSEPHLIYKYSWD